MTEQEHKLTVPGVGPIYAPEGALVPVTDSSVIGGREHLEPKDWAQLGWFRIVNQDDFPFEGTKAGTIVHTGLKTHYDQLVFVGLQYLRKSRCWWPKDMDRNNIPFCYSDDFANPAEPTEFRPMSAQQDGPCATCPYSQWTEEDGNRQAPKCNEQINYLIAGIDESIQQIVEGRFTLQRSMIPNSRQLNDLMDKIELRGTILMTPYLFENDKGMKWYKPGFAAHRVLDHNAIQHMAKLRLSLLERIEAGEIAVGADLSDVDAEEVIVTEDADSKDKPKRRRKATRKRRSQPPEPPPPPDDDEIPF